MQFDARAAKLLQPGAHLTIQGCPGLRLEATQSRRSWTYRYRSPVDGRMRQLKIGQWPAVSFAVAAAEWERLRGARDGGDDPGLTKRQARAEQRQATRVASEQRRSSAYSVRDLCNDYLQGHIDRHRKAKGAMETRRMFDTMLADVEDLAVAEVTRAQAFQLLESFQHIPVQAAKLRSELGAAWDYALDAGRVPETTPNWWRQIMRGRLRSRGKKIEGQSLGKTKRVLTSGEVGELLRWVPNFPRTVADALTLYLWTLARGSEIMAMEAREITEEPDGWWWTVPKVKTKNARHESATDFRVPLVGRALEIVHRRLALHKGYVFPSTGAAGYVEQKAVQTAVHWHQPYSRTRLSQERPRLTVTHWAPHDLRRTGRTLLAALECPDDVAEAMLGHVQEGIKGVYNPHTYDKQRRAWLTRLSDHLESLARVQ